MSPRHEHEVYMDLALGEARRAARAGEVPVGAVLVLGGAVVARAGNRVERDRDPTAHAELLAMRRAIKRERAKWLADARLYVTLEPCAMCAGAIVLARVPHVVFGTRDPKAGAMGSAFDLALTGRANHLPRVTPGVRGAACAELLSSFFRDLRAARADS